MKVFGEEQQPSPVTVVLLAPRGAQVVRACGRGGDGCRGGGGREAAGVGPQQCQRGGVGAAAGETGRMPGVGEA